MLSVKPGLLSETQKLINYRGVVGVIDAIVDNNLLGNRVGIIPHEIKSVTNRNFKYIQKGDVGDHYKLQAGLYALAMGTDYYALDFIASDDLRDRCYVCKTAEVADDINSIIDDFDDMVVNHKVPEWEFRQTWQNNPDYMNYDPEWATATEQQFRGYLEQLGIDY
jgi:hypothetical protein